mgnify:CR=1 FL=1
MARDIVGLLTGISDTQQPVPVPGTPGFRGMFGAQQAQKVGAGLGRMARGGQPSNQENIAAAMGQLDLTTVEGLSKLAKVQQISGDLAGAAQTAAKIQAIKQAEVAEARAKAQEARAVSAEIRAQEAYEFGKIDRLDNKERQKREDDIQREQLALSKARFAISAAGEERASAAAAKALSDENKLLAQQASLRELYAKEAIDRGRPELARYIKANMSLDTAENMLYKTSTAVVKPLTSDETEAYEGIFTTEQIQSLLPPELKDGWLGAGKSLPVFDDISDKTRSAIFLKAKELTIREQLALDKALIKAIEVMGALNLGTEDNGDNNDQKKLDRRGRPVQTQDDDAYTDIGK